MKYYIGEIVTMFGESEVSTTIKFKTELDPHDFLEDVASTFWGTPFEHAEGEMYDFGDKATCAGDWEELDADTYNKLPFIGELNR
jgi:hypothetical protein